VRRDSSVYDLLARAQNMINETKTVQPSGGDSFVAYEYTTGREYDLRLSPTRKVGRGKPDATANLQIRFISEKQATADVAFEAEVLVSGQRMDKLPPNGPYFAYTTFVNTQDEPDIETAKFMNTCNITCGCDVGYTLSVKVKAVSLAKGRLEIWQE